MVLLATPSHLDRLPRHEETLLVICESRGYCLPALSSIPNSGYHRSGASPLDTDIFYAIIYLLPSMPRVCFVTDTRSNMGVIPKKYIFCKRVFTDLRLV